MRTLTLLAAALLLGPSLALAQIGQTATLTGVVTDSSGAALPGVTVTVKGESLIGGTRSSVTDASGTYRFPALPPGIYTVTTELAGFKPSTQQARLQLGQTITVDARLEVGGFAESVNVQAESPVVDVKSSASQKNLDTQVLENVPFASRFGPGAITLAPGVNPNNNSAYGSGGSSGNAYMIDGVDVGDPESGTVWVFANYNWIQEVQVIGLGAGAEYGGFTGVASNSLFRSGSNKFHGLFETLFENGALTGSNTNAALLKANPSLKSGTTDYLTDNTLQVGGPIKLDKLWFFTSGQYYRPKTAPAGYPPTTPAGYTDLKIGPQARLESSPRFLFKPTLRLGPSDQLTGFLEYDSYTVDGRGASATNSSASTLHQDSPEFTWNGNYTKVLSSSSVFDMKYSGFWGYYYLTPYNGDTPGWYDVDQDFYAVNSYYYYKADRVRHQANASLTKYASGFAGSHSLKFGAELERSYVKSEQGYPGKAYINASFGVPYYELLWDGYLKDNVNGRVSAYAQDSWSLGSHFTINPGVRFDHITGFNRHLDDQVFKTNSVSPRIGFAWDLRGNSRTVVRGHYGWYYDGAKSTYYDLLDPKIAPVYGVYVDSNLNRLGTPEVFKPGQNRTMDPNIKQPRMQQAILGLEHELFRGLSVGVTGIYRKNDQFIDDVLQFSPGDFTTRVVTDRGPDNVAGTGDETGATVTTYRQTTNPLNNNYLITNPASAFRKYKGVELTATRRMANRWQLQGSWVISKITGNYNNTSSAGNSATEYNDPNQDPRFQPFREGRLTNDNTHIAKVLATVRGPWDVMLSGAFYYTTGQTFARTMRESLPQGRKELFIEPRGSQRYDDQPRFDMRIEKQFQLTPGRRLGLTLEGFNLANNAAITSRTIRSGPTYFKPQGLVNPRRLRVGAVYRF
jgi:hypothetical protein